jgi:hypothetical protein
MELITMRIVPYSDDGDLEDLETLTIIIKAVPFEDSFIPAFYISSPSEDYMMSIDELSALMDGIEIANKSVDDIIDYILNSKAEEE